MEHDGDVRRSPGRVVSTENCIYLSPVRVGMNYRSLSFCCHGVLAPKNGLNLFPRDEDVKVSGGVKCSMELAVLRAAA